MCEVTKDVEDYKNFMAKFSYIKEADLREKPTLTMDEVRLSKYVKFDVYNESYFTKTDEDIDIFACRTYRWNDTMFWHIELCSKEDLQNIDNFEYEFKGYGIIYLKLKAKGKRVIDNI